MIPSTTGNAWPHCARLCKHHKKRCNPCQAQLGVWPHWEWVWALSRSLVSSTNCVFQLRVQPWQACMQAPWLKDSTPQWASQIKEHSPWKSLCSDVQEPQTTAKLVPNPWPLSTISTTIKIRGKGILKYSCKIVFCIIILIFLYFIGTFPMF